MQKPYKRLFYFFLRLLTKKRRGEPGGSEKYLLKIIFHFEEAQTMFTPVSAAFLTIHN
jgi:hypothetical protein